MKVIPKTKTKKSLVLFLASIMGLFLFIFVLNTHAIEFNTTTVTNKEVLELNQQINDKRKQIDELNKQAELYKKSLASKRREIATLSYQISTINQTITKMQLEKEALELKIDEINLQIQNTQLKIQATEEQIAVQKNHMADLVRALHLSDRKDNLLAILTTNKTLSDYLSQMQNLQNIQDNLLSGLGDMNNLKIALVQDNADLDANKVEIDKLKQDLAAKTDDLETQKDAKFTIMNQTKGEEGKYQQLLQGLKDEQSRINSDIVNLEKVAREKLNRQLQQGKDLGDGSFAWPIDSHIITAYFHDPDYPYRNVFEHPAIDIRTPQGTSIRAASSGYVARAKDAGMGYSYIMLVHDNGLSTVYGHVSRINVTEGTFVTQGQIIGASGGGRGTPGAGSLTTGPHLHFEVRLNGIPVNPLNYLPQ